MTTTTKKAPAKKAAKAPDIVIGGQTFTPEEIERFRAYEAAKEAEKDRPGIHPDDAIADGERLSNVVYKCHYITDDGIVWCANARMAEEGDSVPAITINEGRGWLPGIRGRGADGVMASLDSLNGCAAEIAAHVEARYEVLHGDHEYTSPEAAKQARKEKREKKAK